MGDGWRRPRGLSPEARRKLAAEEAIARILRFFTAEELLHIYDLVHQGEGSPEEGIEIELFFQTITRSVGKMGQPRAHDVVASQYEVLGEVKAFTQKTMQALERLDQKANSFREQALARKEGEPETPDGGSSTSLAWG